MSTLFCVARAPHCSASVPHEARIAPPQAAEIAISSPLLEESIEGAHGALINIAGPSDLKLQEAAAATQLVGKAIHPEAQIIWGLSLDDAYGDEVRVTVIAAGFDANSKKAAQAEAQKQAEPAEARCRCRR